MWLWSNKNHRDNFLQQPDTRIFNQVKSGQIEILYGHLPNEKSGPVVLTNVNTALNKHIYFIYMHLHCHLYKYSLLLVQIAQ